MTPPSKIKTLKELTTLRQLWGWERKKVVFTNGVFDILHAGHVQLHLQPVPLRSAAQETPMPIGHEAP